MKEYKMVNIKDTVSWKPTAFPINENAKNGWVVTNHSFEYGPNVTFILMEREVDETKTS